MTWIRMGGGAKKKPGILTIFDRANGLADGYSLSGSASVVGTSPNLAISVGRGARGALTPTIDCSEYNTLHLKVQGGYTANYPFIIYNGNTELIREGAETVPYEYNIDISNLDILSLNFFGSTATGANSILTIELYNREQTFLYKDGKQVVPWDNSGKKPHPDYTIDSGFTFNPNNMSAIGVGLSANHARTVVTRDAIDFSMYSKLKMTYVINNNETTKTIDVSTINGAYYLGLSVSQYGSNCLISCGIAPEPQNWNAVYVKNEQLYNSATQANFYVSKVWLEK